MLTPQEVSEHGFARARFGGYSMEMVDDFLDRLTADYTTLYKENAVLKTKMKGFAEKLEEYRNSDESMRRALVAAQRVADEMVQKAQTQCDEMVTTAEKDAQARLEELHREIAAEEYRLQAARNASADLARELRERYTRELAFLDKLPELTPQQGQQSPDFVAAAAADIEEHIRRATGGDTDQPSQTAGGTKKLPDLAACTPPDAQTQRIDLDTVEFGKDYKVD